MIPAFVTSHTGGESGNDENHTVTARKQCIKDKEQKVLVIANPDAIVDPGTVVIHLDDTATTHTAVVRSLRFEGFASSTQSSNLLGRKCRRDEVLPLFILLILFSFLIIGQHSIIISIFEFVFWIRNGLGVWWYRSWIRRHGLEV
jgi:hypothetical protein